MKMIVAVVMMMLGIVIAIGTKSAGPAWLFWLGWASIAAGLGLVWLAVREAMYLPDEDEGKEVRPNSLEERCAERAGRGQPPYN